MAASDLPSVLQAFGGDTSVLRDHYTRNRTPRAPNPSRVRRTPSSSSSTPSISGNSEESSRLITTYPTQWQEVIRYAKRMFRAYIAGKNGFPDAITGVRVAREYLEDALATHIRGGSTVEPGESNKLVSMSF